MNVARFIIVKYHVFRQQTTIRFTGYTFSGTPRLLLMIECSMFFGDECSLDNSRDHLPFASLRMHH